MEGAIRYQSAIDLSNENSTHTQLVLLTGEGQKVLEIGPASGYITKLLRERGCHVTCVEVDPDAAARAGQWSDRMIVADIEKLDFDEAFGEERFDVVMLGDVLEHLVDPGAALRRLRGVLKREGRIVASLPNIVHGSIRLSILKGEFNYTETGLLDRTHLRHFTRNTIAALFREAGFSIVTWRRILMDPFTTEMGLREEEFPPWLVEALRADEEAMTYQFAIVAVPSDHPPDDGADTTDHAQQDVVLPATWRMQATVQETTIKLEEAQHELNVMQERIRDLENELQLRNGELEGAYRRISDIENSIGWRTLNRVRPVIRRLAPTGSLRFRLVYATARIAWRTGRLMYWALSAPRRWRRHHKTHSATEAAPGRPVVAPLRFGAYGEHCWSVGGGTVHALQLLIPMSRYYEVDLLLPPGAPVRDRNWYEKNLQIDIGAINVRSYSPGIERKYDVWMSVWNETIKHAPTPQRFNMVFFPFVPLDGKGYTHITNSEYTARYIRERYNTTNVVVIPPCVDADEFSTGPKEPIILHCSRFALPSAYADKAHIMMIQAFRRLCDRGLRGWKLVLAGAAVDEFERTYVNHLAKHAYGYPVEFAVNLSAEELRALFGKASVYWHATGYSVREPAAQEHFGITIVEGMAAGAVPICYNSGGPQEIIQHGESGFLFDTMEEMLDHTLQVINNADLWQRMSIAARNRARCFSPDMVARRISETIAKTHKVSIIIGTHNNLSVLKRAIESILEHTPPGYELIVVNNASTDGTGSYLGSLSYPHLKVLNNPVNESFAAFNNKGLALATRPYVLYLNDDIEALPGWLEPLIYVLDANPKVGAVGPRLLYPDGRVQCDGKMFSADDMTPRHINMGGRPVDDEAPIEVDALTGACLLVRKELAGFSEDYIRGYYEDTDLCLRIKDQGYGLVLHRGSVVIHYHGLTMRRNQTATEEAQQRNRQIFLARWRERIPELVYLASEKELSGTDIRCRPVCPPGNLIQQWPVSRRLIR